MKVRNIICFISMIFTVGIAAYGISIPEHGMIIEEQEHGIYNPDQVIQIHTSHDIVEEYGKIKLTVKKQNYKVKGTIKKKDNYQIYKYLKTGDVIAGSNVKAGDKIGETTVDKTGIITGYDKEYFYVDSFENYYIEARCHPDNLYQASSICNIINGNYEAFTANEDANLLSYFEIESEFLESQGTYILKFDKLKIEHITIGDEISIEFIFGKTVVGVAIEEKYVWTDGERNYLVTAKNVEVDIKITQQIDDLVFFETERYLYNEQYIARDS